MGWYLHDFVAGGVHEHGLFNANVFVIEQHRSLHNTKVIELPDEGIRQSSPPSLLDMPDAGEAIAKVIPHRDLWVQMGKHWMRVHDLPRNTA